jgi:hypothetical protein
VTVDPFLVTTIILTGGLLALAAVFAWFLVGIGQAFLGIAQANLAQANTLGVVEKLDAAMTERIRSTLAGFERKAASDPKVAAQLDEFRKRAQSLGYDARAAEQFPAYTAADFRPNPPIPPVPDPADMDMSAFPHLVES